MYINQRLSYRAIELPSSPKTSISLSSQLLSRRGAAHRNFVCSRSSKFIVQSSYRETDRKQRAPESAPSPSSDREEPPPPPPPPRTRRKNIFQTGPSVLGTIIFLLAGSGLWWWWIDSQFPNVYKDETGVQYMFTEGGNQLVVGEDKQGRVYFIDQNGNFYYDTGDKTLGFYMVSRDNKVYNLFPDREGKRQMTYVGRFEDLRTFKITSLGGIPVEELEKASRTPLGRDFTGFVAPAAPEKTLKNEDFTKRGRPVPLDITEVEIEDKK